MTASFTLLVLSSKDRGASSPSILYPKEESGSHCLLIFVLKPRSAGLKFGSTIHAKSSLFGVSITIPISAHRLALGTWQGIYLCEFRDSGGSRSIVATVMGE